MNELDQLSEQRLGLLEVEALVGECMMPRLQIDQYSQDAEYANLCDRLVRHHKVGGFCVFGGTPETVILTINTLQEIALTSHGVPLVFSADCEFGLPMRLQSGGTEFPEAMAIAKTGDPNYAYDVGRAIGREMRSIGIGWNFAPVADVNSNPLNPIINTRAFGEDPATVARFAGPYMHGLEDARIAATAKHFPGHGDTSLDSHKELPFVEGGWDRFERQELAPFLALVKGNIDSVMPGHLAAPELARYLGASDEEMNLPATLSKPLITTLLREQFGFKGVVVTDALEMHAITKLYGDAEAVLMSFEAGVDLFLLAPDPEAAFQSLMTAVRSERISADELRQRVARIWKLKRTSLILQSELDMSKLADFEREHRKLANEIARKAIEKTGVFDIEASTLVILYDDRPQARLKADSFASKMKSRASSILLMPLSDWRAKGDSINGSNVVLVTFHRARGYIGGVGNEETMPAIVAEIGRKAHDNAINLKGIILFGSPYLDSQLGMEPGFKVKTYSESLASVDAVSGLFPVL